MGITGTGRDGERLYELLCLSLPLTKTSLRDHDCTAKSNTPKKKRARTSYAYFCTERVTSTYTYIYQIIKCLYNLETISFSTCRRLECDTILC